MEMHEKLELFLDLIRCNQPIDYWLYEPSGELIHSSSGNEVLLDSAFRNSGCHSYLFSAATTAPIILTARFDIHWIAVRQLNHGKTEGIHVLGPFFSSNNQENAISWLLGLGAKTMSSHRQQALIEVLRSLSIISMPFYCQYAAMLHFLLNEEHLESTDLHHQTAPVDNTAQHFGKLKNQTPPKDRINIYRAERALLHAIREGDANAAAAAAVSAHSHVGRVRDYTGDSLRNMQIACTTFAAICTRAAIEGGLSTSLSYGLGDGYIKSFFLAKTLEEVADLKDRMYREFVTRVHNLRRNPKYSKPIQSCCDYILLHSTEALSISILAERLGYTKYYLSSRFKEETGCSIIEYIKITRVERAKVLLATTNKSVDEIWEAVGFPSRAVFGKSFLSIVGKSPTQYRKDKLSL